MLNITFVRQLYYAAVVAGCIAVGQLIAVPFYGVLASTVAIIFLTGAFRGAQFDDNFELTFCLGFIAGCVAIGYAWSFLIALIIFCFFFVYWTYDMIAGKSKTSL